MQILFDNRGWIIKVRHVNPDVYRSVKHYLVQSVFDLCFYFDRLQKEAHLWQGAPFHGGQQTFGGHSRTVARKFSIGVLYVCSGGLDILKFDKNSTDL